jgi:hypothetical protein
MYEYKKMSCRGTFEGIVFTSVYRHLQCPAAGLSTTTGKHGTSSFSAINKGAMSQYSDELGVAIELKSMVVDDCLVGWLIGWLIV